VVLEFGKYAVRRDLAEIAVADRIFAQHYVEPLAVRLGASVNVRVRPSTDSETVAVLASGDIFNLIDLGHDWAWGRGDALGSVGYIPTAAFDLP
jgi:hypothetical protein